MFNSARVIELIPDARCRDGRGETTAQRIGRHRCLGCCVLGPVDKHLVLAQLLLHSRHNQLRMVGFQTAGQLVGDVGDFLTGGQTSNGAYRWIPLDPTVHGETSKPLPLNNSRTSLATSTQSTNARPSPGSKSNTMRSGYRSSDVIVPGSEAPGETRHWGICSSSEANCAR